jgi:hypothetical protein
MPVPQRTGRDQPGWRQSEQASVVTPWPWGDLGRACWQSRAWEVAAATQFGQRTSPPKESTQVASHAGGGARHRQSSRSARVARPVGNLAAVVECAGSEAVEGARCHAGGVVRPAGVGEVPQ